MVDTFSIEQYKKMLWQITRTLHNKPLNQQLQDLLNLQFSADSQLVKRLVSASHAGIQAGKLCHREAAGIKFGRAVEPCDELHGFSVDVVHMNNLVGPHHRHPYGEIDLIMPLSSHAKFDGRGAGWLVYGPDSQHHPTVTHGEALILYLLPDGAIEFTGK